MIRTLLTAVATAFAITAASASDLPSRSAPLPPTKPAFAATQSGFYAGVSTGFIGNSSEDFVAGVNGGYEVNRFLRVEGTYDYRYNDNNKVTGLSSSTLMGNAVVQYPIDAFRVTPYVLAGTGYRWADIKNEPVWTVGGGLRYSVTRRFDVDARYRYIDNYDNNRNSNVFTVGLSYKF